MIKILKRFQKFILNAGDVVERVSSGSGPGGQKVNKSENCVNLRHVPTGIYVKVHDSRDLLINRRIAWKRLEAKVEFHFSGEDSKIGRRHERIRRKKERHKRKYSEKHPTQVKPSQDPISDTSSDEK